MPTLLLSVRWHDVFLPQLPWLEKIARPALVYVVLLAIFRVASKRELAQATLFDFLIILLISNVVQNAMIGDDNSVLGAVAGALTLVLLSSVLGRLTARNRQLRIALEGKVALLVNDGVISDAEMRHQQVSRNDLLSAIRKQGIVRLADVRYAVLELDGSISVIKKEDGEGPHDCLPPELVGATSAEHPGAPS